MSRSDSRLAALREDVGEVANVLLLVPAMDSEAEEGCTRLLAPDSGEMLDLLCVTLTGSPDERIEDLRSGLDEGTLDRVGVVGTDDATRSAAASPGSDASVGSVVTVDSVSSPGDLTGIGIKVSSFLGDWHEGDNEIGFCFHSLTTLLQYVDTQSAFRFLHVLTGRLETVGAHAHYHLDPTAHDEQTINTIKTLFDAVVEYEDGEWVVRTR